MIRTTLTKIRRICLLALDARNIRERSGRVHKLSFGASKAHRKATPPESNDVNESESERCQKIIDECFEPHKLEEVQQFHQELARLHEEQLAGLIRMTHYEQCKKCQTIIAKIFDEDKEIDRLPLKEIDRLPLKEIDYTTTAKEGNENELVQKIETIEEAKVVENERIHVEYNQPPRILAANANISNKIDDIAKRCLEKAEKKIDDRLVLDMGKLAIPSFNNDNAQKRLRDSGIVIKEESSEISTKEFELQPPFTNIVRDKNLSEKDDVDSNASLHMGCSIPFHLFHQSALTGDKDYFKKGLSPLELITPAKFEYNLKLHENHDAEQDREQSSNVQSAPLDDISTLKDKISTEEELPAPKDYNQQESNMFDNTQRGFNVISTYETNLLDPNTILTDPYDKSSQIAKENDFGHSYQTLFSSKEQDDYAEWSRQQQQIFAEWLSKQRETYDELLRNQQVNAKEGPNNLKENLMESTSKVKENLGVWSTENGTEWSSNQKEKFAEYSSKPKENLTQWYSENGTEWSRQQQTIFAEWLNKQRETYDEFLRNQQVNVKEGPNNLKENVMGSTSEAKENQEVWSTENGTEWSSKQKEKLAEYLSKPKENLAQWSIIQQENVTECSSKQKENVIERSSKQKENMDESLSKPKENVAESPSAPVKNVAESYDEQQEISKSKYNVSESTNEQQEIVTDLSSKQKEKEEIMEDKTNPAIPHTAMSTMAPAIETTIDPTSKEDVLELTVAPHVQPKIDKVIAETEPALDKILDIVPLAEPKTVDNEQTCTTESIPIIDENCGSLMQLLEQVRRRNKFEYCRSQGSLQMSAESAAEPEGKCKEEKPCPPPAPKCPPKPKPQNPCPPPDPPCPKPCKPKCPSACPAPKSPCDKFVQTPLLKQLILVVSQLCVFPKSSAIEELNQYVKDYTVERIPVTTSPDDFEESEVMTPEVEIILKARDYEPWIPIPSWPIPKKEEKQPPACWEKAGCKLLPPPKLNNPCNENPCKNLPWTRKRSFSWSHLFSRSDDRSFCEWI